ncbi:hypothetical protein M23134_06690 [Microscilla marina ATCC 23134]|uniref:Bacterial HORMA domain-containing protein n=2 Tax=Microscilla marina TaxID=1027 RepID=A1ZW68_MICM2|nr:hypothetical protein M23134_06690 [Microscilla marina ATCC 23134]
MWNAGLITTEKCNSWRADLLYLLNKQVLSQFEFQFRKPNGEQIGGLCQVVKNDGSISIDDDSGGNDFYNLPSNTHVSLLAILDTEAHNYNEANEELEKRGWGNNGKKLTGASNSHGSYSKDGYGLNIKKFGEW